MTGIGLVMLGLLAMTIPWLVRLIAHLDLGRSSNLTHGDEDAEQEP